MILVATMKMKDQNIEFSIYTMKHLAAELTIKKHIFR